MNNNRNISTFSPFITFCQHVIPLAYDESMSYYETLCALRNYLINTVIPAVNKNADAVTELQKAFETLQNYIDNYFKNLDVQSEINNKLDDMAESGELTDIIAQYLEVASILAFDTISDLKNANNLNEGSFTYCFGRESYNDGYGNYYKVRKLINTDTLDNENLIALTNYPELVAEKIKNIFKKVLNSTADFINVYPLVNEIYETTNFYSDYTGGKGNYIIKLKTNDANNIDTFQTANPNLIAELIYSKENINVKMLGAKGDNVNDDTSIIKYAISQMTNGGNLIFPKGEYKITDSITFTENNPEINFIGNKSIFHINLQNQNTYAFNMYTSNDTNYIRATFKDLRIINESESSLNINGFHLKRNTECTLFDNVSVESFYDNIVTGDNWFIKFNRLKSINSINSNFKCEDDSAINVFNFSSCIFQNSNNINFHLTGKSHILNNCDLAVYKGNGNQFTYCDGLTINSMYYEDSNLINQGLYFNVCNGVTINGSYFETNNTNSGFKLINASNARGLSINSCEFRGLETTTGYIIYLNNGCWVTIDASYFRNVTNGIYVQNSAVYSNYNVLENVTQFIYQFNHNFARVYGNFVNPTDVTNSYLPQKGYTDIKVVTQPNAGATSVRPTGYIVGQQYFNTDTKSLDLFDGSAWV